MKDAVGSCVQSAYQTCVGLPTKGLKHFEAYYSPYPGVHSHGVLEACIIVGVCVAGIVGVAWAIAYTQK